jgi:hypothetical protein
MDLFFPDLSNFQPGVDFAALRGQASVVAEQVSWGTQVTIPAGRITAMRAARFDLIIWYLGITAANSAAQVAAFVDTLGALLPNEAICIDWESTGNIPPPPASQRDEIQSLLAQHYGIPLRLIGIYGPDSLLRNSSPKGWVWTASYETAEPVTPHKIWQFTNGQYVSRPYGPINFAGVGFCDASVFHGTSAELVAVVCPTPAPPTEGSVYMIPSGCTDNGSVCAQIREWWTTYRSDQMLQANVDIILVFFRMPTNQTGWGVAGWGGNPDLMLANIIDTAGTNLRPQFVGAV